VSEQQPDVRPEVRREPDRSRWAVYVDGAEAAYAEYELRPGTIVFTHTVTDPAYAGRGLASVLVSRALADVRDEGERRVEAQCSFVAHYLAKHAPEEPWLADLVAGPAAT
jgi:predicted GNAT family acetyltransferase